VAEQEGSYDGSVRTLLIDTGNLLELWAVILRVVTVKKRAHLEATPLLNTSNKKKDQVKAKSYLD